MLYAAHLAINIRITDFEIRNHCCPVKMEKCDFHFYKG
jgi:hypothetical protein